MFVQNFLPDHNHIQQQIHQLTSPKSETSPYSNPTTLRAYIFEKSRKKNPTIPKFRRAIYQSKQEKLIMKRQELIKLIDKMCKELEKIKLEISKNQQLEELRHEEEKLKQVSALLEGKLTFQNLFNEYKQLIITAEVQDPHFEVDEVMKSIQDKIQRHFDIIGENKEKYPRKIEKEEIKRRLQSRKIQQYIVQSNVNDNFFDQYQNKHKNIFKNKEEENKRGSKFSFQKRDFNTVMAESTYLNDKQIQKNNTHQKQRKSNKNSEVVIQRSQREYEHLQNKKQFSYKQF